ncbi:LysR family transcriptional regulator [Verminephrobacter aporrectodeae]|nr:LysR family transcriptional regulator [Verminephrobacter aporrectodeae]
MITRLVEAHSVDFATLRKPPEHQLPVDAGTTMAAPHRTLSTARWMLTFAKIVECGGISAAARALDQDKAVISRQLRDLERSLGLRLLNRSTQHVSLTDVGRAIHDRAVRIVQELDGVRSDVEHFLAVPSGVLSISTSVAFGRLQLVPLLPEFIRRYPQVQVELCLLDRSVDLVEEGFDLLIRLCDEPPQHLSAARICDLSHVLVAASGTLAQAPVIRQPEDLAGRNCLFYGFRNRHTTWRLLRDGIAHAVSVTSSLSVNSSEAARELALAGMGVALLPRYAVAADLKNGRLHRVLPEYRVEGSTGNALFILHMPGRYQSPKIRAFIEFLRSHWLPTPPWEQN